MKVKAAGLGAAVAVLGLLVVGLIVIAMGANRDGGSARDGESELPAPTASPIQPAPNEGDITETVAPGAAGPTVRVKLGEVARLDNGVRIRILGTKSRKVDAGGPGEGGGAAVVGRIEIVNGSRDAIDVGGAIVTLLYGDDQVAEPSTANPSSPFRGTLQRGESARGVYVFRVPRGSDSTLTAVVQYGAGAGVARFVP